MNQNIANLFIVVSLVLFGLTGCEKEKDAVAVGTELVPTHTISELKALQSEAPLTINEQVVISATVTAYHQGEHAINQLIVEDETGAIGIELDGNFKDQFEVGDGLYINAKGLTLGDYKGVLRLGLGTDSKNQVLRIPVSVISRHLIPAEAEYNATPIEVSIEELGGSHNNRLVTIKNLEFSGTNLPYNQALAQEVQLITCDGEQSIAFDFDASLTNELVKSGNGDVTGIFSLYDGVKRILIRSQEDVASMVNERCFIEVKDPVIEDFSEGIKTNMEPSTVLLKSGNWLFSEATLDGKGNANDVVAPGNKNAVRLRGAANGSVEGLMVQEFDYFGLKTVTIQHAQSRFGSPKDGIPSWELQISKDGGVSWQKFGETIVIPTKGELYTAVFNIDAAADETVRIKIKNTSTPNGADLIRLNISEIKFEF